MKFLATLLIALTIPLVAISQNESRTNKKKITPATFNGEAPEEAFPRWFTAQLTAEDAANAEAIDTPFLVAITIDEQGHVSDIGNNAGIDSVRFARIESAIDASPDWSPARKRKKPIESTYYLLRKSPDGELLLKHEDDAGTVMPKFMDGDLQQFRQWVVRQLVYPQGDLRLNRGGTVKISFMVDHKGNTLIRELISSPGVAFTAEAARVIVLSPPWTPGSIEGFPVNVYYVLPVSFKPGGGETPAK
jgi:hypothetical protein